MTNFESKVFPWPTLTLADGLWLPQVWEIVETTAVSRRVQLAEADGGSKTPPIIVVLESPRLNLTIDEAAIYLRCSRRTIYTLMENKQLTFTRVREGLRFRLQWLNEYMDKRTVLAA